MGLDTFPGYYREKYAKMSFSEKSAANYDSKYYIFPSVFLRKTYMVMSE